jgi:hypothetical protein
MFVTAAGMEYNVGCYCFDNSLLERYTMSQGSVFIPPCPECGGQLYAGKNFCGKCRWRIDWNIVFQSAGGSQVSSPRVLENLTLEQFREARLSQVNPYADWGILVCDDSKQRMWPDHYNRTFKLSNIL